MRKRALDSSFDEVAKALAPELRTQARESGWPEEVVQMLSVESRNGYIVPVVPEMVREQVEELEYGNRSTSPSGVLHKMFHSHEMGRQVEEVEEFSMNELAADLERIWR